MLRMTAQLTGPGGPLAAGSRGGSGGPLCRGLCFTRAGVPGREPVAGGISGAYGDGGLRPGAAAAPPGLFIPGTQPGFGRPGPLPPASELLGLGSGGGDHGASVPSLSPGRHGHAGQLVPVSIALGSKRVQLTALRDSGNTLSDPFSGQGVLVAQYDTAERLLPICRDQLRDPGKALEALHAQAPAVKCRLIPYRAVGAGGLLLAVQCDQVTIGGKPAGLWWPLRRTGCRRRGVRGFDRRGTVCINFG